MLKKSIENKYPNLFQFFASYFHEDWDLDHSTADEVVDCFIYENPKNVVIQVLEELSELQISYPNEDDLKDRIFALGCYYIPHVTFNEWITHLKIVFSRAVR